jgi:anti-anti-sigma factor
VRPVNPEEGGRVEHTGQIDSEPPNTREVPRRAASVEVARVLRATADAGYVVVEVVGDVDILSRHELAAALAGADRCGVPAVIVDLSAVTLLSAAAFHCLQDAAGPLTAQGGELHLVCPSGCVSDRILRIFDPHGAWPRHPSQCAAVAAIGGALRSGLLRSTQHDAAKLLSRSCPRPARP